jgi:hypothetical protein
LALPKQQPEPKPSPPPSVRNLTINVDDNQKNIGQSTVITTAIQGTFEAHNFNVADLSLVSDSIDFFKDLNFDSSTKEFSVKLNPSDTDGTYDLRL